jgi:hypothetical protein
MAVMPARYRVGAALLSVLLVLLAGCGGSDGDKNASPSTATSADSPATETTTTAVGPRSGDAIASIASMPGALKSAPPWPANNGPSLQLRLRALGLEPLREEGQVVHIHQHLDLFINGDKVTVPANIGIDAGGGFISDLHTHDPSGIMHVESPTERDFTLGQFFGVWGLPLSEECIGSLCAKGGKALRVWVNGDEVPGDPTRIVLEEHQEIAITYGTAAQMPDPIPQSFDFEAVGL